MRDAARERAMRATAAQTRKALKTFSSQAQILTKLLRSLKYGSLFQVGENDAGPSALPVVDEVAEAAVRDALRQWLEDWL